MHFTGIYCIHVFSASTRENYQMPVRGVDNYGREANIGDNRLCFVYFLSTTRSKHTPCWASIPCLSFSANIFLARPMSFSLGQCLSLSANVFLSRPMSFSLGQCLSLSANVFLSQPFIEPHVHSTTTAKCFKFRGQDALDYFPDSQLINPP